MVEAKIRLCFSTPVVITITEYEQILRDIHARFLVGDLTLGDRLMHQLLDGLHPRYIEATLQNEVYEKERSESHDSGAARVGEDDPGT